MFSLVRGISKLLSRNAGNCFVLGYVEKFYNFWRDLYFWMHLNVCCRQRYGDVPNDIPYHVPYVFPMVFPSHVPNVSVPNDKVQKVPYSVPHHVPNLLNQPP
jgi:hypothetical protein